MDAYDRKARLYPAACVAFPVTFVGALLFGATDWWKGIGAIVVAGGLHIMVIQIVRDLGTTKQEELWNAWGGAPTTAAMRWSGATNLIAHARLHHDVQAATGVVLPSTTDEATNPDTADQIYETAIGVLRQLTKRDGFQGVRTEVANYGFRRNLYGCRTIALTVATAVLLVETTCAALVRDHAAISTALAAGAGISVLALLAWTFLVTPDFVRRDATRYTHTLLAAAASLPPATYPASQGPPPHPST